MGIKDVFDRIKGKSDPHSDAGKDKDAKAARRQTDEETIQVKLGDPASNVAANAQQQAATIVAPPIHRPMPKARPSAAERDAARHETDATVVVPPGEAAGTPRPAATPTREIIPPASNAQPDTSDATVAAPRSSAPVPQRPAATSVAAEPSSPQPSSPQPPTPFSPSTTPVAQKAAPASASPAAPSPVSSGDETQYASPDADTDNEIAGVLVGLFGAAKGLVFTVPAGQCTLGRAESCEIHVLDAKISREHAAISCVDGRVEIRALNERNPIIVNDGDSAETQSVADGDKLQFGNAGASIFRFRTIDGL